MALGNLPSAKSATGAGVEATPVVLVNAAGDPTYGSTGGGTGGGAVTVADGADVTFGAQADAAAAADSSTASFMSLFRRLLGKFPISTGIKNSAGSLSVAPASDAVFLTRNPPAVLVDFSGTAGVAAADKLAANANRRGFWIYNASDAAIWVNTTAAAVVGSPSLAILAGAYYETPPGGAGTGAISIIGIKAGQSYSAREWT